MFLNSKCENYFCTKPHIENTQFLILKTFISKRSNKALKGTIVNLALSSLLRGCLQFLYIPFSFLLTLSLLGYLKTRICWGGGQFDPHSKSHVLCPNMTNDTSLESSCALLLESAKKICKFAKIEFFIAKSS